MNPPGKKTELYIVSKYLPMKYLLINFTTHETGRPYRVPVTFLDTGRHSEPAWEELVRTSVTHWPKHTR